MKYLLLMLVVCSTIPAAAKWYTNYAYNFKINVPASWSFNQSVERTDHVYDFLSPDEQVAIQIRAFKNEPNFTDDLIMGIVEEGILSQGATKLTAADDQINGIYGKMAAYKNTFDGMEVGIVIFTTLQERAGYAFIVVVPSDVFQEKTAETDAILNTFTLLQHQPLSKRPSHAKDLSRSGQPGGSLGGSRGSGHRQSHGVAVEHAGSASAHPGKHVASDISGATLNRPSGQADHGYKWCTEVRNLHFQVPASYKPYNYGYYEALHSWSGSAGTITLRVYRGGRKQGFENLQSAMTTMKAMDNMNHIGIRNIRGYMMHMFQSETKERQKNQNHKRIDHVLLTVNNDVAWFSFVGDKSNYRNMDKEAKHLLNSLHKGVYK